jgi:hypothetical protein
LSVLHISFFLGVPSQIACILLHSSVTPRPGRPVAVSLFLEFHDEPAFSSQWMNPSKCGGGLSLRSKLRQAEVSGTAEALGKRLPTRFSGFPFWTRFRHRNFCSLARRSTDANRLAGVLASPFYGALSCAKPSFPPLIMHISPRRSPRHVDTLFGNFLDLQNAQQPERVA